MALGRITATRGALSIPLCLLVRSHSFPRPFCELFGLAVGAQASHFCDLFGVAFGAQASHKWYKDPLTAFKI